MQDFGSGDGGSNPPGSIAINPLILTFLDRRQFLDILGMPILLSSIRYQDVLIAMNEKFEQYRTWIMGFLMILVVCLVAVCAYYIGVDAGYQIGVANGFAIV